MMDIGTLGAGTVAQTFALNAISAGHLVALSNKRGPKTLGSLIDKLGEGASAVSAAEAARRPIVLLAVPWPAVEDTLRAIPSWGGQILIDATNGFNDGSPAGGLVDFDGGSSSEFVASLAPGARVVKAMNALFMNHFGDEPLSDGLRQVTFVSGDDRDARATVADLFESFGFAPVELGSLAVGGRIQGVGGPIAGHNFYVPWPEPRSFPAFNGEGAQS